MGKADSLLLILLASGIVFGYTYSLDLIQALQVPFREEPYCFSTLQFNLMYFFTFLPILLFNIPIGTLIDRNPVTPSLFILLAVSLGAQVVGTFMVESRVSGYIIVMYAMRACFGLAGEGIFTVQSIIVTRYSKHHFQVVMSLCLSIPFLMDSVNSFLTTRIYDSTHEMTTPWQISIGVCLLSLVCGLIVYKIFFSKPSRGNLRDSLVSLEEKHQIEEDEVKSENKGGSQQETFSFRELRSFPFVFWVLIVSEFFTEISLGSFNDNLNDLLVKRFNIPYVDAGLLLVIPFLFVAIFSIVLSLVMSKYPLLRRSLYAASTALYLAGQISLYFLPTTQNPTAMHYVFVAFFCLTASFGFAMLFSGLQAAIPYVVEKRSIGTAYGVLGCVVGLSQSVMPFVNIAIIDSDQDLSVSYTTLNLTYIGFASISMGLAIYIKLGKFQNVDQKFQDLEDEQPQDNSRHTLNNSLQPQSH